MVTERSLHEGRTAFEIDWAASKARIALEVVLHNR